MLNKKEKTAYTLTIIVALLFASWWLFNFIWASPGDKSLELYSDTYWVTALVGSVIGFIAAKQWGGWKSIFGKSLCFFSLGMLAQVAGQLTYSYFAIVKGVETPYPSVGDIGFFGSIIFYILGIIFLSKAIGAHFNKASKGQKVIAVLIPLLILVGSYAIFLRSYEFSGDPLVTFLDFGYPLGQALYLSLALLAYILSFRLLGGTMKNKILLLLFALAVQYSADFNYLYRVNHEQWYAGDINDFQYQTAYLLMTLALLSIGAVVTKLRAKN